MRRRAGSQREFACARQVGDLMFPIARDHVAQSVLVTDDAIRAAQKALWDHVRVATEPGGAAAMAALLLRALPAGKGRAGGGAGLRRQHHRRRFRLTIAAPAASSPPPVV